MNNSFIVLALETITLHKYIGETNVSAKVASETLFSSIKYPAIFSADYYLENGD